ncbi:hypothetical protein TRVL_04655 [Trypanosoma vivax]|uniref:Uncharacterized protein n=1 Tax=Trypanosoma vivax (strain Y486) TaxID=1055687 RepID=G0U3X0_TRYVY|nr:hypothetical protein TRVL_04655 [Trypanosoma vivax]CCC52130.1 conserved hypothetical protein [Trypanosoma vivax Y486]
MCASTFSTYSMNCIYQRWSCRRPLHSCCGLVSGRCFSGHNTAFAPTGVPASQRQHKTEPSHTYTGKRVSRYTISPVIWENHSLWQWRTVECGGQLFVAPFLLCGVPGISARRPFLHHTVAELIVSVGDDGQFNRHSIAVVSRTNGSVAPGLVGTNASSTERYLERRCAGIVMPSPVGSLPPTITFRTSGPQSTALWVDKLFDFLEQGVCRTAEELPGTSTVHFAAYSDTFAPMASTKSDNPAYCTAPKRQATTPVRGIINTCHVPSLHRNVIGSLLADTILAIDRLGAVLSRRQITLANACWAVLVDSNASMRPYLRRSALAIERDLLAATAAHQAVNASLGDPMKRPRITLSTYPTIAGWENLL